ncbi:MAG: class I SAM-dependent methyltransferase [Pirellulaceae bacterium]|nr:class I SAM-dependent methyltransferase [Pirellulaceae bacterium]
MRTSWTAPLFAQYKPEAQASELFTSEHTRLRFGLVKIGISSRKWRCPASVGSRWLLLAVASLLSAACQAQPPAVIDAPAVVDTPTATDSATDPIATIDAPADRGTDLDSAVSDRPKPVERARKTYLGRVLAKPMSHLGASWLIRPERDEEERASESFKQLKLTEGMTVCDLGCGNGYWTLPMARDVGATGRVLAVDIQREMLKKLVIRGAKAKLENIVPVLGDVDDPNLPAGEVDLLLMVDVYHEFSHPQSMLWAIRNSLKPEGVIALLEYREEDPKVPIKPLHKMSKRQIMKEYEANGFKLVREYNKLPWQHLMFFARDDSPLEKIEPMPASEVLQALPSE